jgi:urea transport system ATP-binding protein
MGLEAVATSQHPDRIGAVDEMYDLFPALKVNPRKAAGTLSGGQQQQLALARSLVRRPQLLLLDEPTEGLQPTIVQEIEELLHGMRQRRDTTILLVEQFLDFAMSVADHCYVMEKGAIVLEGPTNNLDQNMIREYLAV